MDSVIDQVQSIMMLSDEAFELERESVTKIISNVETRLLLRLKGKVDSVPDDLSFIVVDVAIKRINRRKNEGMSSYGQEGETVTYESNNADFAEFDDDIKAWLDTNGDSSAKVKFIDGWGDQLIFDKVATFKQIDSGYDPNAGKNAEVVINQTTLLVNMTDTGTTRASQIFGDLKNQTKVIRLNELPGFNWSYVEVDGMKYVAVTSRTPLKSNTLIVSETNEF